MLRLLALILALFVFGCAGHDAGSAVEVTAASRSARARLWPTVDAIVHSFAREHGFRLWHERKKQPRFQTYSEYYSAISLVVFPDTDSIRIEISETGVSFPSQKQRSILRGLRERLEAAGLVVTRTEPHIIVTF
jgi:hypothetical protein